MYVKKVYNTSEYECTASLDIIFEFRLILLNVMLRTRVLDISERQWRAQPGRGMDS